jgi:hypothetical protein
MNSTERINPAEVIGRLNAPERSERLAAAEEVGRLIDQQLITREPLREVNNHVHTQYSFSPYYPAMAAFRAWEAGLQIVGSIDHDSISAAEEMLLAGASIGIATTVGFEVRCSFLDTPLAEKKINNPDSRGIVYMCVHGVPAQHIEQVKEFLRPVNRVRNIRNRAEVEALNALMAPSGITALDFLDDVASLSQMDEDGSITERHILYALAGRLIDSCGIGAPLVTFLEQTLQLSLSGAIREYLLDEQNPHYRYDLLGILKSAYLPEFFIQPSREETIPVEEVVDFCRTIGAIPAYAYLGDVTESPTGDKKAEKFEDSFLDELFDLIDEIGFQAVTYMPPRNSKEQLLRVQSLARTHGLMEISGVDINSSRQKFNCPELLEPEFEHLIDSAWALVAHEKLAFHDPSLALFSDRNPLHDQPLSKRIERYARIGREMDPGRPESVVGLMEKTEEQES